ncbi:MAG: thiamine pyrophosphate-binding protein [Hahellaceae bacterium]|nr:thiamine pyrophosphate-binding protein [Hahellaceae bacterium]MCP5168996.1 thiamine pyrophosphate-binding protein [Hahellaceae bacterium]
MGQAEYNHGGDLVAGVLRNAGVSTIFTLCGGHISPILAGCKHQGIEVVDARHEASAVFAADAMARMTGIPGVAAVTAGPGVTNAITALKNAQMAQSPLILLGGASATVLRGRGSLQDIDQLSIVRSCVKWAVSVDKVHDIESVMDQALSVAKSGVPGPVFVELPIDLLYPEKFVREWYGLKGGDQGKGITKKAIGWYLNRHLTHLFESAGDGLKRQVEQTRQYFFQASREQWQQEIAKPLLSMAVKQFNRARKPVMVVGSQAVCEPAQVPVLVHALNKLGVPVYLSGMARGVLGEEHPLQMRHQRKMALKDADLVILAGVPCDFRLDYGSHISRKAALISVNRHAGDLLRNRIPTVPVHGDPAGFLNALALCPKSTSPDSGWLASLRERDTARNQEILEQSQRAAAEGGVNPLALFLALDELLPANSVLVADGGDFVATAAYTLRPKRQLSWLDPGVYGTLGVGGGFALGARYSRPDAEVWVIWGDGSSAYSLSEIDTFVRHGKGMVALIGNDAKWNQIARDQVELLGDDVGVMLRQSDYHKVAQGYGGEGLLLAKQEDIVPVLEKAQRLARKGKAVVVNVLLAASDFRKGSISV